VPRARGLNRPELGRSSRFEQLELRRLLSITPPQMTALTTFDPGNAALIGGLNAVANWANQLDTYGAVGAAVPIANQSAGQALNLHDLLGTQFDAAVQSYLTSTPGATADGLAAFLANNQWVLPEAGLTLTDHGSPVATMLGNDLLIGVDLQATRTANVPLDLNSATSGSPIGFDAAAQGALSATFDFSFSFGLDLTAYLEAQSLQQQSGSQQSGSQQSGAQPLATPALDPRFVLNANGNALTANADFAQSPKGIVDSQGNAITGHVGFLGGTLSSTGTIAVNDNLTLNLPSGDLHSSDFATPSLGGRLTLSGAGSLAATLPFQAVLSGTQTFNGTLNATASPLFTSLAASTPAAVAVPTITGPDATAITAFENVTSQDVQGGLVQLAGAFDNLRTSALAMPVPFTGQKLSDVVDLKKIYDQVMA